MAMTAKIRKAFAWFPHAFSPRVSLERVPRVRVSQKAYTQMYHLVDLSDQEVAWLGVVSQPKPGQYFIEEIFIFDQVVSGASAALDPAGVASVAEKLLMSTDPDNLRKVNSLFLWGHSHVHMGTSPSGQDDRQLEEFGQNQGVDYMIRLIANKNGRLEFTFRDYKRGLKIADIPWTAELLDQAERETIEAEIKAKVRSGGFISGGGGYTTYRDNYPSDFGDGFEAVIDAGRKIVNGVRNFLNQPASSPPPAKKIELEDGPEVQLRPEKPFRPPKRRHHKR